MRMTLPLLLATALVLTGCARISESRLNPLNWFGSSQPVQNVDTAGNLRPLVTGDQIAQVLDGRVLVSTIDSLEVLRTPDGAIVRATGIAPVQGAFNAQLVPVAQEGGVLTLAFRVELPRTTAAAGTPNSRRITAARVLSRAELSSVRSVRVQGQQNARIASR